MIINKYSVQMYEFGSKELNKSKEVIASSEEEAINKTIDDKWWYNEGTGYNHKELKYPLEFKAVIKTK